MNEAKKLIAKMVDSGEYFSEAKNWYAYKYIYPYTHRFYILLVGVFVACFTYLMIQVSVIDYIKKKYPFPIYFEDVVKLYPKIKGISKGIEPIPISVSRYLLSQYVITRESYDYNMLNKESWERMLRRIRAMSSRKIFSNFVDYIDTSKNPESPVLRYKYNVKRIINIEKVVFPSNSYNPDTAKVYFTASEKGKDVDNTHRYIANIEFSMTDVDNVIDNDAPLQFTVTKYIVTDNKSRW